MSVRFRKNFKLRAMCSATWRGSSSFASIWSTKKNFELTCWPSDNSSHCKSAKEKYYKLCGHSRPGPAGAGVLFVTSRVHGLRLL
jgi:hypothetical protein